MVQWQVHPLRSWWVESSAKSYQDLVNWSCSLLTRRTVCGRAARNLPRIQKTNRVKWSRNCTTSVVALQDQCSYKTPTSNHHIQKISGDRIMTLKHQWRYLNLTRNSFCILCLAKDIVSSQGNHLYPSLNHRGPHKMPSRATCGPWPQTRVTCSPRVWDSWLRGWGKTAKTVT